MQATMPWVFVPGDNTESTYANGHRIRSRIMARSGSCLGINPRLAVWRFGFSSESEAAHAYGVSIEPPEGAGFMWVLAARTTGEAKDTFFGFACDLPSSFQTVLNWEPAPRPHRDLDNLKRDII